jgi:(p)ppGpp synthase/HD superfamily hydrolase
MNKECKRALLINDAKAFAIDAHAGQKRKYKDEDYVNHPIRVASRVTQVPGNTTEMVMAALLHDVIEDTKVTESDIRQKFGDKVANLVVELTNVKSIGTREQRKALDRERISRISKQAKIIKALDRIDNLTDMKGTAPKDFSIIYSHESILLAQTLEKSIPEYLYDDLVEAAINVLQCNVAK